MPPIELPPELAKKYGVTPGREENIRYRVLRAFCIGNGVDLEVGQEITLPRRIASQWAATGRLAPIVVVRADADELEHTPIPISTTATRPRPTRRRAKAAE